MDIERNEAFLTRFVATQLKQRRERGNITQEKLAQLLGVHIQVIQSAELGVERLSASSLYEACQVFGVSLRRFFKDYAEALEAEQAPEIVTNLPEEQRVN